MDSPAFAVDSGPQSTEWVDLHNDLFSLKMPRGKLLERFDARVLSTDERQQLGPILDEWERIAREKKKAYDSDKAERQPIKYSRENPFLNSQYIIAGLKCDLDHKNNYYVGAYDKKTAQLQAVGAVTFCDENNRFSIQYLATHPGNIRCKLNKNRISGAVSRVILEIEDRAKKFEIAEIKVSALTGCRTFYQHIGFQPLRPPHRYFWMHFISSEAKIKWMEKNQEYLKNPILEEEDKTEESSEEDDFNKVILDLKEINI